MNEKSFMEDKLNGQVDFAFYKGSENANLMNL